MADTNRAKQSPSRHFGWRGSLIFILSFLGVTLLVGFMFAHWTERQVLTTDNWVKIVAPLPKDDQVSTALSDYTVSSLFENVDLESKVEQALPDKASFLAPPITDRLQVRITSVTKSFIQSDQFQNIWVLANKTAHQRLVDRARGTSTSVAASLPKPQFDLDLQGLRANIQSRLGQSSEPLFNGPEAVPPSQQVDLKTNLSTSFATFKKFVNTTDFLNSVLLPASLACLLGAFIVSQRRRRLLITLSLSLLVIALLQLIGAKAVRPALLDHIANETYRPAIGVIYDSLTATFRHGATLLAFLSAAVLAGAYFSQQRFLKHSKFVTKQTRAWQKSTSYRYIQEARQSLRQYWLWAAGGIILLASGLAAFAFELDWQGVVRLTLITIVLIELTQLLSARELNKAHR